MWGYYILKDHKVVAFKGGVLKWAQWMETDNHRIVAQEYVGHKFVSTVFLGLDHSFLMQGNPPLVFETMIFDKEGYSEFMARYATWEEATQGHEKALMRVKQLQYN